jgi:CO/xanthine dehydrogenase FAD-binding subunit
VPARGTYHKRRHPATAEDRLAGSRLTPDATDAAAHAANIGNTFTGNAFGAATYPAELLPIHLSGALSQIATPPIPTE